MKMGRCHAQLHFGDALQLLFATYDETLCGWHQAAMSSTSEGPLERTSPSIAVSAGFSVGFSAGLPFGTSAAFVSCKATVLSSKRNAECCFGLGLTIWFSSIHHMLAHTSTCLSSNMQTHTQTDKQTDRDTDRGTDRHRQTHTDTKSAPISNAVFKAQSTLTTGRLTFSSYSSSSTCCTLSTPTTPCKFSLTLTCRQYKPWTQAA